MTDPIWLSPLSHEVPWAGREPLPEAPPLWARWCCIQGCTDLRSAHALETWSAGWPCEPDRAGFTPLARVPRVESGRTA